MYGTTSNTLYLAAGGSLGTGAVAETLADYGNNLWVPFAIVALTFAAASAKTLLTRPADHRP